MIHNTWPKTDNASVWHKLLTGELKKSELNVTIRASILGVGVLYIRFGKLYKNKVWYLTASENHLQKF